MKIIRVDETTGKREVVGGDYLGVSLSTVAAIAKTLAEREMRRRDDVNQNIHIQQGTHGEKTYHYFCLEERGTGRCIVYYFAVEQSELENALKADWLVGWGS
jgi:hypothetical protein